MVSSRKKIALFGGSFNPPHIGHVAICRELLKNNYDLIFVIPVFQHAFDKSLETFEHRLQLCQLAFDGMDVRIQILDIEKKMGGKSFSLNTLRALKKEYPNAEWFFVLGEDAARDLEKWHDHPALKKEATFVIFKRGEHSNIPDVSSSALREALRGIRSAEMIPKKVLEYIRKKGLYH